MPFIPLCSAEDRPFGVEEGNGKQFIYAHANAKCVALVRPHPKAAPGFLYLSDVQCLNFEVCTGSKVGEQRPHFWLSIYLTRTTFPAVIFYCVNGTSINYIAMRLLCTVLQIARDNTKDRRGDELVLTPIADTCHAKNWSCVP